MRTRTALALCLLLFLVTASVGLYFWTNSAGFEALIRKRTIDLLEKSTGGRVDIASFHWHLMNLEADAQGIVLHGTESAGDAPYAQVERLRIRFTILSLLWNPHLLLRDLEVVQPSVHLIVYQDGSTNQPEPRKQAHEQSGLATLFDLQAGHISFEQGLFHLENRAEAFDYQNRFIPLDFDARDFSLRMAYVPAATGRDESYHIETAAAAIVLTRARTAPSNGAFQATVDLTRNAAYLRSLRIVSRFPNVQDRSLEVRGTLQDFSHPHWQAKATGDVDLRLLNPIFGYPDVPEGIAHLDLDASGAGGEFRADGPIHIEDASYLGPGVTAKGLRVDTRVHADASRLLISQIVIRFRQGGQINAEMSLSPWLPPLPGATEMSAPQIDTVRATGTHDRTVIVRHIIEIPYNGKIAATFKNVALDTVLDTLAQPPWRRLGLDARLNGPATASWSHGDPATTTIGALFDLDPTGKPEAGEVPTSGALDWTYTQRDGAVDLRKFEIHTPASVFDAHGNLGAVPLSRPSGLAVDLHSANLADFDQVLRNLGLSRYGKTGAAALPISLGGQGDFHGTWTGSLVNPRIAGTVKTSQIAIEMALAAAATPTPATAQQPKFVSWDSVDVTGSYAAERIAIDHAVLRRGKSQLSVDGTLDASTANNTLTYDSNSVVRAHVRAAQTDMQELLTLAGQDLPITGSLDAQLQADGPIDALNGSGWAELNNGAAYGEPLKRVRAEGKLTNQDLRLSSLVATSAAGTISATGSYNLHSRAFQVDAKGSAIELAQIKSFQDQHVNASGKLGLTVSGSGTLDDPRLEGRMTVGDLALGGEELGGLDLTARAANHLINYDGSSRVEGAEVTLHGQTALKPDYLTQAKLDFSHFNINALLKMAHVQGLEGESALAGTVTLEGPLARPTEMHGDALLRELAVVLDGVHLQSQGPVHATLAGGRVTLDPLHVTGEETDLHVQGSLELRDKQQLDVAASGSINLKLAETLDPDLSASGNSTFQLEAHGPLSNPDFRGRIDFQDGALALEDVPNGLSQLHGTLEFNQNRLEVKSLTAMSGGGQLSVAGYLAYQHGIYADLSVTGKSIRIRYPQGVSSLADITMHLQGPQTNLLLAGSVLITRFSVSTDLDLAALAAQANSVQTIAPPDAPSNHIHLDVHVSSSPQLNFQNAFAKLAGNVDLRLRGTVASPSLLGRVSITEGNAIIAGTRYDLQRGDVFFSNPVRIEPSIDLNATAHVSDYDITLGLHGTPDKMSVTYRSDPPLPEADVVALLALGRTENQQRLYTEQQEQSLSNPTTDALLGGALNATVSSRVQKLFGAGSVKVDPNYLGALGNSTSRIIVEEQVGRDLTLTYATNVDTTGQQLIQAEIAINRHVSLLVARDESGVFSMVVKATRRYR
jgi:translocation and assembly module TamB